MTAMVLLSTWMESQVEFWRPIPGWSDYDVSNFGRVRSWRVVKPLSNRGGTTSTRGQKPRMLKPHIPKAGYPIVSLGRKFKTDRGKGIAAHRIVALAFLPNPENKPSVNHLTGYKADARLDGLAWATWKEQSKHAWANGLHRRDRVAFSHKMVKARRDQGMHLPDELIRLIRSLLDYGFSQGQIRRWSGMKAMTIQNIAVRRTYQHVA